jgi:hypothetical protein
MVYVVDTAPVFHWVDLGSNLGQGHMRTKSQTQIIFLIGKFRPKWFHNIDA